MSMLTVALFGLPSLGAWMLGAIADRSGIPVAYAIGGAAVATVAIGIALFSPDLRELVSETTPVRRERRRRAVTMTATAARRPPRPRPRAGLQRPLLRACCSPRRAPR